MGKLLFGKQETLTCITNVEMRGPEGQALCLGFKTSSFFVGGGVYVRDEGYVLRLRDTADRYLPVTSEQLGELQATGAVPTPLPPYSIPVFEYLFGYSLWIVIAGVVVFGAVQSRLRAKRQAADAQTAISFGPPALLTKADQFVAEQSNPRLEPNEVVQHQAYTCDTDPTDAIGAATAKACYAVLTDRRILLFQARLGAFGPLLENRGSETIDRAAIRGVRVEDRTILLSLADGGTRTFWVSPTKKLSNQREFLRDVPRILAPASAG